MTSTRRHVRDLEPAVEKKPQFEIDLRVEGASQYAISQDEEKMKEISNKSWKSCKLDDAQNPFVTICRTVNRIFSEESSRLPDEEKMKDINKKLEKLQIG